MKKTCTPPPRILRGAILATILVVCCFFYGCSNQSDGLYLAQASVSYVYSGNDSTPHETNCSICFNYEYTEKEIFYSYSIKAKAYFDDSTDIYCNLYIDGEVFSYSSSFSKTLITPNTSISILLYFSKPYEVTDYSTLFQGHSTITVELYKGKETSISSKTMSISDILKELEKGD